MLCFSGKNISAYSYCIAQSIGTYSLENKFPRAIIQKVTILHVGVYRVTPLTPYIIQLTLIHLTPYRYSYQPTCMPFPSAQCVYHIWIRSAGNVSISFSLWRGTGVMVFTVRVYRGKTERRGGARAQFSRNAASFYALFTHFLPQNNVKERLLHSINERNNLLRFSGWILLQICLYSTLLG